MKGTWINVVGEVVVLGLVMAGSALAAQEPRGRNYGPPQEAIQACEGMNEGDSVSFALPDGQTVTGTCRQMRDTLVAMPASSSGGRRQGRDCGPPPEAIEACEGMNEGDAVSFESRRGETISGTCQDMGGQLVAVPEGGPPRGGNHRVRGPQS